MGSAGRSSPVLCRPRLIFIGKGNIVRSNGRAFEDHTEVERPLSHNNRRCSFVDKDDAAVRILSYMSHGQNPEQVKDTAAEYEAAAGYVCTLFYNDDGTTARAGENGSIH